MTHLIDQKFCPSEENGPAFPLHLRLEASRPDWVRPVSAEHSWTHRRHETIPCDSHWAPLAAFACKLNAL